MYLPFWQKVFVMRTSPSLLSFFNSDSYLLHQEPPETWISLPKDRRGKKAVKGSELSCVSWVQKSMKTGGQWWTVNRLERIWRRQSQKLTVISPCLQILWRYNLPRCDHQSTAKRLLLSLAVTLWRVGPDAEETKIQSEGWSIVTDALWWKCDSVSASWLCEQHRTACRSVWNTIVPRQLQVSNFYGTKIGLCCRPL